MVAETATRKRIEIELRSLELMLGDLADVAEAWAHLPDAERAAWSLDWDQLMGGLKATLDPAYRNGAMAPDHRERYRGLLGSLEQALPMIDRLRLYRPSVRSKP
jgi:hypothetical protein